MEETIRVCIRQRPLFRKEIERGNIKAWQLKDDGTLTLNYKPSQGPPIRQSYSFDMCFDEHSTNKIVYEKTARDIVRDTAKGINGCYMAYGQTGCGKTYSIMGTPEDPGILPRAISELFTLIEQGNLDEENPEIYDTEYLLRVSYIEIYLERVNDLFQDGPKGETQPLENLDVKEDPKGGFNVVGLAEREVTCMNDVMKLIRTAEIKRHFATTNFNEMSSRSHTVFTAIVECTQTFDDGAVITRRGELKLVDLAGNERATSGDGLEDAKERLAEGQAINKSLFLLSEVIAKLSKRAELQKKGLSVDKVKKELFHIPWRDSKLTRLLQKALGGNARACLLVAVHPSLQSLEISLSTLRFAMKTKQIKKKIVENFVSVEKSLIMKQKDTINKLRRQLEELQNSKSVEYQTTGENPDDALRTTNVDYSTWYKNDQRNESVDKLKKALEHKIEKLSKLILHTHDEASQQDSNKRDTLARSVTISGYQNRYKRLQTASKYIQRKLYYPRKFQKSIDIVDNSNPILYTLKYLMNSNREALVSDDSLPNSSIEQTAKENLLTVVVGKDQESKLASTSRKMLLKIMLENKNLKKRNTKMLTEIEFLKQFFTTLGLSSMFTSTDVVVESTLPKLTFALQNLSQKTFQDVENKKFFINFIRHKQPLAHAMLYKLFSRLTGRYFNIDIENQKPMKTFFGFLSPWEIHILALAYEQQEVENSLEALKEKFSKEVKDLKNQIHFLQINRMELFDHTCRLLDELRNFRYDKCLQGKPEITEKFGKILKQLNGMSLELVETTTLNENLQVKYDKEVTEKKQLQEQIQKLTRQFVNFDTTILVPSKNELYQDKEYKSLIKEVLESRQIAAEARFGLEESEILLYDLQRVNKQLSSEVSLLYSKYQTADNDRKLLRFELHCERKDFQKQLQDLYTMLTQKQNECKELQTKLSQVTEENAKMLKLTNMPSKASDVWNRQISRYKSLYTYGLNKIKSVGSMKDRHASMAEGESSVTAESRFFQTPSFKLNKRPLPSFQKSVTPFKTSLSYRPQLMKTVLPKLNKKYTLPLLSQRFKLKKHTPLK